MTEGRLRLAQLLAMGAALGVDQPTVDMAISSGLPLRSPGECICGKRISLNKTRCLACKLAEEAAQKGGAA